MQAPSSAIDAGIISFCDLIDFVAHLADCYPVKTAEVPDQLIDILTVHHRDLQPELREKIIGSLVLLRKKGIIDSHKSGHPWSIILQADELQTLADFLPHSHNHSKQIVKNSPVSKDIIGSENVECQVNQPSVQSYYTNSTLRSDSF